MPVLGSTTTGYAVSKRGLVIPDGSLDIWRAARALHATDRPEVVFTGDSTWWGQVSAGDTPAGSNLYSANNRSPVGQIRQLSVAAGFTDGGPGIVSLFDSALQLNSAVDPVTAGWTATQAGPASSSSAIGGLFGSYSPKLDSTQTITYKAVATCARIYACKSADSGSFTYAINGGSAVTVTPGTGNTGWSSTYISGMPSGQTNTIVITNVSGTNRLDVEFLNATGIVYHKHCVPGAQVGSFVMNPDDSAYNWPLQLAVGAAQVGTAQASAESTHPAFRKARLNVWTLGINDINSVSLQTEITAADNTTPANTRVIRRDAEVFGQSLTTYIQASRNAGSDVVVCIPHWKISQAQHGKAGYIMAPMVEAIARANGCVFVDLNEALGGAAGAVPSTYVAGSDVHLKAAGYNQLGSWFWSNVLSV